jgi:hypothetical protein
VCVASGDWDPGQKEWNVDWRPVDPYQGDYTGRAFWYKNGRAPNQPAKHAFVGLAKPGDPQAETCDKAE